MADDRGHPWHGAGRTRPPGVSPEFFRFRIGSQDRFPVYKSGMVTGLLLEIWYNPLDPTLAEDGDFLGALSRDTAVIITHYPNGSRTWGPPRSLFPEAYKVRT